MATVNASTGEVTLVGAGSATITATRAADANYNAVSDSYVLTVGKADQAALNAGADVPKTFGDAAFTQAATGGSGTGALSYNSSDTSVATVTSSGEVTVVSAGNTTITATKAADASYNATSDSYVLTVAPVAPGNLTASPGSGQITLSWDGVSGAESYSVYYALASFGTPVDIVNYSSYSGGTLIQNISTNSRTVTGLTNGTAYYFVVTATNSAESAGSSEVSSTPSPWVQQSADIDGEAAGDKSGYSVSLSSDGTVVAIGALFNDGNGSDSGHTRIYQYSGGSWSPLGSDIDGEAAGNQSGYSVSLSSDGTVVAIGARYNDGNGSDSGHTRIYQYSGGSWSQLGSDIDGEAAGDQSGTSVSLSSDGTVVAIGATGNDGNGSISGHTRIYKYSGGSWSQLGADIDGEAADDYAGYSVSLSSDGTVVAIGAPFNDGNGSRSGHTRIYKYSENSWSPLGSDIDGEAANDRSGFSVSLSGDGSDGTVVAIGALFNDGNGSDSGHTRIYQYSGGRWVQLGADIDGEAAGDKSGYPVSLSSDGTVVAIGAFANDGNGSSSGHTRIYQYSGSSWSQLGTDIDGEAAGDTSGYSVSLSSDGTVVAIGADANDGNGSNSGHVRVFKRDKS